MSSHDSSPQEDGFEMTTETATQEQVDSMNRLLSLPAIEGALDFDCQEPQVVLDGDIRQESKMDHDPLTKRVAGALWNLNNGNDEYTLDVALGHAERILMLPPIVGLLEIVAEAARQENATGQLQVLLDRWWRNA